MILPVGDKKSIVTQVSFAKITTYDDNHSVPLCIYPCVFVIKKAHACGSAIFAQLNCVAKWSAHMRTMLWQTHPPMLSKRKWEATAKSTEILTYWQRTKWCQQQLVGNAAVRMNAQTHLRTHRQKSQKHNAAMAHGISSGGIKRHKKWDVITKQQRYGRWHTGSGRRQDGVQFHAVLPRPSPAKSSAAPWTSAHCLSGSSSWTGSASLCAAIHLWQTSATVTTKHPLNCTHSHSS